MIIAVASHMFPQKCTFVSLTLFSIEDKVEKDGLP